MGSGCGAQLVELLLPIPRSVVQIQSSANFYRTFVYCQWCSTEENKEKEAGNGQFFLKKLHMTGFEPGSSGIRSDRSVNCAITPVHWILLFLLETTPKSIRIDPFFFLYAIITLPFTFSLSLLLLLLPMFCASWTWVSEFPANFPPNSRLQNIRATWTTQPKFWPVFHIPRCVSKMANLSALYFAASKMFSKFLSNNRFCLNCSSTALIRMEGFIPN